MKPAAIFGLVVRSFGVYLLSNAVTALGGYFAVIGVEMSGHHISRLGFIHIIILAAAAAWFLHGAPPIQDWAYPGSTREKNLDSAATPKAQGPFCVSCGKPIPAGATNCPACGWTQPG